MRGWFKAALVLAFLSGAPPASALDAARTLSQYVHRIWQVQQGLPDASIYAVVQTHDGYLWLGTKTGLVKFDGFRFTAVRELGTVSLSNVWITHLAEDRDGSLWVGTSNAGVIRLRNAEATRYSTREGLPSNSIQCVLPDADGQVWVCTSNGLARIAREKVRVLGPDEGVTKSVQAGCIASDGKLTIAAESRLATWAGSRFIAQVPASPNPRTVQALLCSRDGSLWIGTTNGLTRMAGGSEERITAADGLADNSVLTLAESHDGAVLVGTTNGFSRVRGRTVESFRTTDGLSQSTVYALYEDHESTLWVATKQGLNQFIDGRAIPYTTREGLPSNNTGPVFQDSRGTIWVGTLGDGLARFDGHRFVALTARTGLASNSIYALAEDAAGDVWVGTSGGLNRIHGDRVIGTWTTRQGLPDNAVRALFVAGDGTLWIATPHGPAALRHGVLGPVADPRDERAEPILTFGEDRSRKVYAAPDAESPALRHAAATYEDADGLLWVGTLGEGLRLVDGNRIVTVSVADGLFDDVIYGIVADDVDRLWIACSKGIFSVKRSDLRQFAAGTIRRIVSRSYNTLDLSRTIEPQPGVQPVVSRMQDGRLWFSTIRGVLVIDPNRVDRRYRAPAVAIDYVTVDGRRALASPKDALPAGPKNLEFGYTGLSFISPRSITFRYKLEGFDEKWIDAGSRREAFYTNLPPGHFRFRVTACNPGDACGEAPNSVAFVIEPRYYQRAWFLPLCAIAVIMAGWAMYRLHMRRLQQRFALILAERNRIARELHDTLIQGFSGITMALQALASRMPPSPERGTIEEIVSDAGVSLREARQSLQGLRSGSDERSGLRTALAQTARHLTEAKAVRLKLSLAECAAALPTDVEYNVLRIAQEAVLNAVKHSGARSLHVSLSSSPERLCLSVEDDGVGFEGDALSPVGHYGLVGMKERAAQIGADLQVSSALGHGTTVCVVVRM